MRARGQATVELALGTLVLVTVLLYGIAFAEWGVAIQKVKGSVAFAISTAHGQRTFLFSNGNVSSGDTMDKFDPPRAGDRAEKRYQDFDPLTPAGTGKWTQAMAQAQGFSSRCAASNALSFRLQRVTSTSHRGAAGDPLINQVFDYLDNRFDRRGGVACTSQAELTLVNIPKRFAEGGNGFFKEKHLERASLPLCGVGFPKNGKCNGQLLALTGDWALEGPLNGGLKELNDDVPNEDAAVVNRPYRQLVREVWEKNGKDQGNANEKMFKQLTGITGKGQTTGGYGDPWLDTDEFHMSYLGDAMGRNQVNVQSRELRDDNRLKYQTSGANLDSSYVKWDEPSGDIKGVPPCYLGLRGCQ